MLVTDRRHLLALLAATAVAGPAGAAPRAYALDPSGSEVRFVYRLSGAPATGTMPVSRADLVLDFDRVANSRATVVLDATRTSTGFPFATEALRSASMLNTAAHPTIRFDSTRITAKGSGASMTGQVTIRGVTRPLVLDAQIFRRAGSAAGDLSRLTVRLSGRLNRSDFGASGYSDLVAERVDLQITARLQQRA